MSERWQEMQAAAERLERTFERTKHRMTYSERSQAERDIRLLKDEALKHRQRYVNWLWGYG